MMKRAKKLTKESNERDRRTAMASVQTQMNETQRKTYETMILDLKTQIKVLEQAQLVQSSQQAQDTKYSSGPQSNNTHIASDNVQNRYTQSTGYVNQSHGDVNYAHSTNQPPVMSQAPVTGQTPVMNQQPVMNEPTYFVRGREHAQQASTVYPPYHAPKNAWVSPPQCPPSRTWIPPLQFPPPPAPPSVIPTPPAATYLKVNGTPQTDPNGIHNNLLIEVINKLTNSITELKSEVSILSKQQQSMKERSIHCSCEISQRTNSYGNDCCRMDHTNHLQRNRTNPDKRQMCGNRYKMNDSCITYSPNNEKVCKECNVWNPAVHPAHTETSKRDSCTSPSVPLSNSSAPDMASPKVRTKNACTSPLKLRKTQDTQTTPISQRTACKSTSPSSPNPICNPSRIPFDSPQIKAPKDDILDTTSCLPNEKNRKGILKNPNKVHWNFQHENVKSQNTAIPPISLFKKAMDDINRHTVVNTVENGKRRQTLVDEHVQNDNDHSISEVSCLAVVTNTNANVKDVYGNYKYEYNWKDNINNGYIVVETAELISIQDTQPENLLYMTDNEKVKMIGQQDIELENMMYMTNSEKLHSHTYAPDAKWDTASTAPYVHQTEKCNNIRTDKYANSQEPNIKELNNEGNGKNKSKGNLTEEGKPMEILNLVNSLIPCQVQPLRPHSTNATDIPSLHTPGITDETVSKN